MIRDLKVLLEDHGDVEVKCWPYDGQQEPGVPDLDLVVNTEPFYVELNVV